MNLYNREAKNAVTVGSLKLANSIGVKLWSINACNRVVLKLCPETVYVEMAPGKLNLCIKITLSCIETYGNLLYVVIGYKPVVVQ